MPGTAFGGLKAAKTNKERHGDDFYKKIGSKGGRAPSTKPRGFAAHPELARLAGAKGGRISRRTGAWSESAEIINKNIEVIKRRYYEEMEPSESIAADYGVPGTTLRYWLRKLEKKIDND